MARVFQCDRCGTFESKGKRSTSESAEITILPKESEHPKTWEVCGNCHSEIQRVLSTIGKE